MEARFQRGILAQYPRITLAMVPATLRFLSAALFSANAYAVEPDDDPLSIENSINSPNPPREVKRADIDTENFEFGLDSGLMSIEDFETNSTVSAYLNYHVTEDFFLQARGGTSTAGESSFERLSGAAQLLDEDQRDLAFYDLSIGWNLFPGESFLLDRWAVRSSFFVVGGVGATDFAGNEAFTVNAGMGYRMIANDFMTFSVQIRDRVFETELTGTPKNTHNLEFTAGLSFFF